MISDPIIIHDKDPGYTVSQIAVPPHYEEYLQRIIIPNGLIQDRIERLARHVHDDAAGRPLHILCVLKGGDKVFGDLNKALDTLNTSRLSVPITYDFIRASSYVNTQSTGTVHLAGDFTNLTGRDILIVEDVVDTGKTLKRLIEEIQKSDPRSLRTLSLLEKRVGEIPAAKADYVGFSIPDEFVVGYCLDYNERFRDLHHIGILNKKGIETFKK